MKNLKFIQSAFFALLIVLSIGACKDACKDSPCLNGATCTDVDGEAVCDCAAGYEGDDCGTEMRAKFLGTYDVSGACPPNTINSYSCAISNHPDDVIRLVFSNFSNMDAGGATNDLYAEIETSTELDIPLQTITSPNGDVDFSGSGRITATNQVIVDYSLISPFSTKACSDTFNLQ